MRPYKYTSLTYIIEKDINLITLIIKNKEIQNTCILNVFQASLLERL